MPREGAVLARLRLIATLPPPQHFAGCALDIARDRIAALRALGATVREFDTSAFYADDRATLQPQIDDLRSFQADAVIGMPNAGYAVEIVVRDGSPEGEVRNLFLDVLALPTILYWDHPLVQSPKYVVPSWPSSPGESTDGVLGRIRRLMRHPLAVHFFPDSGQLSELRRLGVADFGGDRCFIHGVSAEFDEGHGVSPDERQDHLVAFFGNVRTGATRTIQYEDPALTAVRERALAVCMSDWDRPPYHAYREAIGALEPDERARLRLDVDQSFYWRFLYDEVCVVANGEPRFRKVLSCGRPLTYFGGFADVESRALAAEAGVTLASQYLPYGRALAAAYRRARVSIDVVNAPFISGFSPKLLSCFASGGFMLTTRTADMRVALGRLVDSIGFSSADQLADRVEYYLSRDRERRELTREIQDVVGRHWTLAAQYGRTIPMALDQLRRA